MSNFYKKTLLTLACSVLFIASRAQSVLEDMVNAIRNSNVTAIEKYYDNIVPITMNNTQSAYSRTQASLVLKDFFTRNVPKDVLILNSGSANSNSQFAIGTYTTTSGATYNLYILLKSKDNVFLLQELRFNK
jgi:predicted phosphoadenosine phosphosulfate sulfurtransferase